MNMHGLIAYYRRYPERSPWGFSWRIGVESTAAGLIVAVLLSFVLPLPERELLNLTVREVFILMTVVAPILETLLFQALPIFIVRRLKGSFGLQIAISTLLFSLAHLPEGLITGISAGLIGGLYFAFAYAYWRKRSRWKAFRVTAVAHSIHNGIAFLLLLLAGQWG